MSPAAAPLELDHTVLLTLPWDEAFDIGSDTGRPVDDRDYRDYQVPPFKFTGKIDKLTISVEPPVVTLPAGDSF
jgi:hypothetical protein